MTGERRITEKNNLEKGCFFLTFFQKFPKDRDIKQHEIRKGKNYQTFQNNAITIPH